jgi:hypothetical protein
MKFKELLVGVCIIASPSIFAHGVTLAKAAELSLHRVERLVALCNLGDATQPINIPGKPGYDATKCKNDPSKPKKGIDPNYQNKIAGLSIEFLAHENEEDPTFKSVISQKVLADGILRKIEIILDEEGRPLSSIESPLVKATAETPVVWTDKDPTTLSENSLHYVIDNVATKPELVPYSDNLKSFSISQVKTAQGEVVAEVKYVAQNVTEILFVNMKLNGDFHSAKVVAP